MPGDSPSWPHHRCDSWIRDHNRPGFPQLLAARTHIRNVQHAPTARTRQQLVDHASCRCARPRTSEGTTLNTCRARRWRRRHRPRQPSAPNRLNSPRPPRRRRDLHDASRCHLDGRIGTRGRRGRRRRRRLRHGQGLKVHPPQNEKGRPPGFVGRIILPKMRKASTTAAHFGEALQTDTDLHRAFARCWGT